MPELSQRPYLLRAMLDWIVDNGWTPHLIVDARSEAVTVPRQFVTEGYIRLNISASATQSFRIDANVVEFNARFGGVGHYINVPLEHVLAIVARENGKGMAFTAEQESGEAAEPAIDGGDSGNEEQPPEPPTTTPERPRQRPSLKLVK
ncbi:MAG: ClpXP protease specificity-enhancing factor [Pseudomonadota bacterium]